MYGLLKLWRVDGSGSYIDGEKLSSTSIEKLNLAASNHVTVRLGVKADARNVGGMNIFGRRCGNYPQDLVLRLHYVFPEGNKAYKLK